ncbi:MAG: glycosyltransferase [Bacteroidetes bacterium]|nr:glycosyltransferase [Bacteroidota bacterium]MBS1633123.1 glycosyltransferase [Bacteroidota bacterium]
MPKTTISVIIPARNEEKNIGLLLQKIKEQSYPENLFEVIVIDDHSEDKTAEIVKNYNAVTLIRLQENNINSYKKKAIETGIALAKNELIVTTDADCIPGPDWLKNIAALKEKKDSVFIAAPVVYDNNNSLLQIFQSLDFLALQGFTGVAVEENVLPMSNGANMAYTRQVFYEVNGFSGIDTLASGDDMLLMYKIWKKYPGQCHYLKAKPAITHTAPVKTWKEFFNQRIRWASKTSKYKDKKIMPVLLLVYLFNLSFPALLIALFRDPYPFNIGTGVWLLILWIAKTIVELPFIYSVAVFFEKQSLLKYYFILQPVHIAYILFTGLFSQTGKYEWKGRKVR